MRWIIKSRMSITHWI